MNKKKKKDPQFSPSISDAIRLAHVNGNDYDERRCPEHNGIRLPKGTWFQERLEYLRNQYRRNSEREDIKRILRADRRR